MIEKTSREDFTYGEYIWHGLWYLFIFTTLNLLAFYINFFLSDNKILSFVNLTFAVLTYIIAFTRPIGAFKKFAYWSDFNENTFLKVFTAIVYWPMFLGWKAYRAVKHTKTWFIERIRENKQRKIDMRNPYFDNIESTLRLIKRLRALQQDTLNTEDAEATKQQLLLAEEHLLKLRNEAPALAARNANKDNLNDITSQLTELRESYALTKEARDEIDTLTASTISQN